MTSHNRSANDGLREEPATELELHKMLIHRQRGTSPGNPKWYKKAECGVPFVFKPHAKPVFPLHVRPNPIKKPLDASYRCLGGPFDGEELAICAEFSRFDYETLPFTVKNETGRYVLKDNPDQLYNRRKETDKILIYEPISNKN